MPSRIIIRIEITPDAKEAFNDAAKRHGMTQIGLTSHLLEWLAGQHPGVQAAILGQYPKTIEADVATLLLDRVPGRE
jgi:hypothetical protein